MFRSPVQVSLDVVYLKDTSWGKYDKVVGLYCYLVEIDRGFHFSGSAKYENLAFQAHRVVGVQSQQFLADSGADEPFLGQVYFRQFFFHVYRAFSVNIMRLLHVSASLVVASCLHVVVGDASLCLFHLRLQLAEPPADADAVSA